MNTLEIIFGILAWAAIAVFLIIDANNPPLFDELRKAYASVLTGRTSYNSFATLFIAEHSILYEKDTRETKVLKNLLPTVLADEEFIRATLSDPHITYRKFLQCWKRNGLDAVPAQQCPPLDKKLRDGRGKEILDWLVDNGYCEKDTLRWIYTGEHSSYLNAMFADAIGKELGYRTRRWQRFQSFWPMSNYKATLDRALDPSSLGYASNLEIVRRICPNYDGKPNIV